MAMGKMTRNRNFRMEFDKDGKPARLITVSTAEQEMSQAEVESTFKILTGQKDQLEAGIHAAEARLAEIKIPKETAEMKRMSELLQSMKATEEYKNIMAQLKVSKEQFAELKEQVDLLRPWFEKMTGVDQKQTGTG
jgi:hypothetical protein